MVAEVVSDRSGSKDQNVLLCPSRVCSNGAGLAATCPSPRSKPNCSPRQVVRLPFTLRLQLR